MRLTKREKMLVALLCAVLTVVTATVYGVMPLLADIRQKDTRLLDLEREEMQMRAALSQAAGADEALETAYARADEVSARFLPAGGTWDAERYVLSFADRSGVVCSSFGLTAYEAASVAAYDSPESAVFYPLGELAERIRSEEGTAAQSGGTDGAAAQGGEVLLRTTATVDVRGDMLSLASLLDELADAGHAAHLTALSIQPDGEGGRLRWELPVTAKLSVTLYSVDKIG